MNQFQNILTQNKFLILAVLALLFLAFYYRSQKYAVLNQLTEEIGKMVEQPYTTENFRSFSSTEGYLHDGKYVIRGSRNQRFCSDDPNGIICNRDEPGPFEMFTVQHLGGNNYAIRGYRSGLWCTLTPTGIRCNSPTVSDEQVFKLHPLGDRKYGIKSNKNQKWCVDSGYGLVCDTQSMYGWDFQEFEFLPIRYNNIK